MGLSCIVEKSIVELGMVKAKLERLERLRTIRILYIILLVLGCVG